MSALDDIEVRAADDADTRDLLAVERAAFGQDTEAELVAALLGGDEVAPGLSLVAVEAGEIVGHVLFSRARAGDRDAVLLAPLAVLPGRQGVGIGATLVRAGLERAWAAGFGLALVLGDPAYYTRFGFEPAEQHGLMPPYPVEPAEAWMVLELIPGSLQCAAGIVMLAEVFMRPELWRE